MKTAQELARLAYEAHATAQANRAGRGKAIHPWECLKAPEQASWEAVIKSVVLDINSVFDPAPSDDGRLTMAQAREIIADCSMFGFNLAISGNFLPVESTYLQAEFFAEDSKKPDHLALQKTRKWLLSTHMTKSELVQTAFKCLLTAVEHEARENFKYRGHPIFGPHLSVDKLVELHELGDAEETRL